MTSANWQDNQIVKLRDRGQLTIPEKIRNLLPWLVSNAILKLEAKKEQVIISPLLPAFKKEKNRLSNKEWEEAMQTFHRIRKSGRQINAVKSIVEDRANH